MSWFSRLVNVVRGRRLDRDLADEIGFHLEARAADLVKEGLSVEEANRRALQQFGNQLRVRESSRDVKVMPWLDSILRDIGFGVRLCRRYRAVTAAAVISLSLAIGACAAAFSLIDALILRPLPVDDPRSLIYVAQRAPADTRDGLSFNYPLFGQLREASRSHVRLFAMSDQARRDASFDGGEPERVYGQWVSGDAFALLGVKPAIGRLLTSADDVNPGQHPVAVLSHDFWMRRFGGSVDVLGRWVTIRDKRLQIIGVVEKGFAGVEPGIATDVWASTMMWDERAITSPDTRWFRIWGRMQPGVGSEQARAVLQTVFTGFQRDQAARRAEASREWIERFVSTRVHLRSAANGFSALREDFASALWALAGVALLVLLIACANVASLLVARANSRMREMALRVSLGAGRGRLIQQVLIESGLLALASCVLGGLLAMLMAPAIVSMLSTSSAAVHLDIRLDWRLLAFLAAGGGIVTLLFGLAPAIRASAVLPGDALKSGSARHTGRIGLFRPLVAAQVAFGFVVLFVSGLCLTSFVTLLDTDLGFERHNLALARVAIVPADHAGPQDDEDPSEESAQTAAIWRGLIEQLEQMSGIESASLSGWSLFEGRGRNKAVRIAGRPVDAYMPWYLPVSPGFLATMQIPLVAGRDFDWRDAQAATFSGNPSATPAAASAVSSAVIVNESFARRFFPGESPLGKRFVRIDGGATLSAQDIIGVAADAKYTDLRDAAPPTVYEPFQPESAAVVQVRTRLEASELTAMLRQELARSPTAFRLTDVTLQSTLVDSHMVRDRALALLSAFFSIVAIILVVVGLYGVLNYSVVQRTREIGIRLALGARPLTVARLVLSDVGTMTITGLALGACGALAAARFIQDLLFEVTPSDAWSIAAPLTCLLAACTLSTLPAIYRALRISPTTPLQGE